MSIDLNGRNPELEKEVERSLSRLLLYASDLNPDELRRCCARVFKSETARISLVDPRIQLPDKVQGIVDSFVLRALDSEDSTPKVKADSLSYLLNPESLARIRTESIVAIEKILIAMSNDEVLRSADTKWHPTSQDLTLSFNERVKEYEGMFRFGGNQGTPFSISVLRIISAANLTADLVQPLKELAKSCLKSIQPVAPELLALRMSTIELNTWKTDPRTYSIDSKPLGWKKDFATFHSALRLLQSNKLADIKDFVLGEPTAIDLGSWNRVANILQQRGSDHSSDLDKDEFSGLGDFAAVDIDHDERLTDVEYYRYLLEEIKQRTVDTASNQIRVFAKGVESFKQSTGAFPKTLEALRNETKELKPGTISDPWGTPYHFSTDGTSFLIRSNGPDRIADTDDDLTSRE